MQKGDYKPTRLFYILIASLIISALVSPIALMLVFGFWFFYALINWANKINQEKDS